MFRSSRHPTKTYLVALWLVLTLVLSVASVAHADGATATVPVGPSPFALAFDPMNGDVYVANFNSRTVSVISGSSNTVVANVTVGSHPSAMAVDTADGDVYVANFWAGTVSVISGSTNQVVATVTVGPGPVAVAFDPVNGEIYVANVDSGTV